MAEKGNFKDSLVRVVALVGLVLVLLLGAWGIILLAFNLSSFVSSIGSTVGSAFNVGNNQSYTQNDTNPPANTQTGNTSNTAPAASNSNTSNSNTAPSQQPAATKSYPQSSYIAAPRVTQLYGYADLSARILSVQPSSVYGGQNTVQFQVQNVGSNVAAAGWSFNAQLPVGYNYTYTAPGQRALYPGDRIVYTLTFSQGSGYGNYNNGGNCDWNNNNYYNGYGSYNSYNDSSYNHYHDYQNCNYNQGYTNYYSGGTLTITVDPYNLTYDPNRGNNIVSVPVNAYNNTYSTFQYNSNQYYPYNY